MILHTNSASNGWPGERACSPLSRPTRHPSWAIQSSSLPVHLYAWDSACLIRAHCNGVRYNPLLRAIWLYPDSASSLIPPAPNYYRSGCHRDGSTPCVIGKKRGRSFAITPTKTLRGSKQEWQSLCDNDGIAPSVVRANVAEPLPYL